SGRVWRSGRSGTDRRAAWALGASALMGATALWFLAELQSAGAPGVAERVVTFVQALWPFLVVVSCRRGVGSRSGGEGRDGG
ncbi:DUF998 domain-containing protein, partial [Streptomyces cavourensis]|nr:DUF998 domain-containing protein [Streptomyces cavourensis]